MCALNTGHMKHCVRRMMGARRVWLHVSRETSRHDRYALGLGTSAYWCALGLGRFPLHTGVPLGWGPLHTGMP